MALLEDYLYSEEFLFEGEQAEEYKKRKAAEAKKQANKEMDRADNRYLRGNKVPGGQAHLNRSKYKSASTEKEKEKVLDSYDKQREKMAIEL